MSIGRKKLDVSTISMVVYLDVCTYFWTFVHFSFLDQIIQKLYVSRYKGVYEIKNWRRPQSNLHFPCRYLRQLIVAWMCHNRCVVWNHKKVSLMSKYGVEDGDVVPNPISFKDYLRKLLKRGFWGEDVVLYALSIIYDIRITVLNACTLDEYRY